MESVSDDRSATTVQRLVRFETELWNAVDARLRKDSDLTLGRYETMRIIADRDGCRVYDIADEMSVTVGGISKIVDRIEASGHCRRRANPDDRRSFIIELTPAGQQALARAKPALDDELELRLGSVLSERALQQLGTALTKLRSAPIER